MARIGLDARMVDTKESGLGRYARELARRLPVIDPADEYVIIKRPCMRDQALSESPNATEVLLDGWLDHPRNLLSGPGIDRLQLDLYHSLHHFLPPALGTARVVMTLHDLIWVEHAQLTFDDRHASFKWRANQVYGTATMWHALRRADHVIAISEHTAGRAAARFSVPRERLTVVHHGVDPCRFEPEEPRPEAANPYLFSLGNSKPYKNLPVLVRALAIVLAQRPDVDLVIAGRGDSLESLTELARRLGVADHLHYTGMIDDKEVCRLFQGARALVFPSLIEGFGFPLVEAMAAGCPVITSDIPVIREIVGEAALRVDPTAPKDLATAILRVLDSPELRDQLRAEGRARARRFDWGHCAEQTLQVYRQVLGQV